MSEELVNDFEFQLSQGFEFSHGAQTEVATHLKVFAPNGKVIQHTAILENEINSAVFKVAEKVSQNPNNNENIPQLTKEKTDDDSSDYESIIMVISANANLLTCFQALKAILTTKTPGMKGYGNSGMAVRRLSALKS